MRIVFVGPIGAMTLAGYAYYKADPLLKVEQESHAVYAESRRGS
jgi:hypothetical protein